MVGTPYYPYQLLKPPAGVTIRQDEDGFEITTTMRTAVGWVFFSFALLLFAMALVPGAEPTKPLLIALVFSIVGARSLFGKITIGARGDAGWLTHQWGPIQKTERFSWEEIEGIGGAAVGILETALGMPADYEPPPGLRDNFSGREDAIILQKVNDRIIFGTSLSGRRKWYVMKALQDLETARRQAGLS
jgi:hypothetical protein